MNTNPSYSDDSPPPSRGVWLSWSSSSTDRWWCVASVLPPNGAVSTGPTDAVCTDNAGDRQR